MINCPICGLQDCNDCGGDGLVYIATYGLYPQPAGYPMKLDDWKAMKLAEGKVDAQ